MGSVMGWYLHLTMTDLEDIAEPVDGRMARRQRNIDAVLDVVLELFAEEMLFPSIEQAATRSGLSLRSLYRYFADPGELLQAAIRRSREQGIEVSRLHKIGQGPLGQRIDDFVSMRLRLYEAFGPGFRATTANAAKLPQIRDEQAKTRNDMRDQFEKQFAREISARTTTDQEATVVAGDLITQFDSIDYLRRHRELSQDETVVMLTATLQALLR